MNYKFLLFVLFLNFSNGLCARTNPPTQNISKKVLPAEMVMLKFKNVVSSKILPTDNSEINYATILKTVVRNQQNINDIGIVANGINDNILNHTDNKLANLAIGYAYGDITHNINQIFIASIWHKINYAALLPVKLILFDAKLVANKVLISWNTTQESNSNYFTVQHSTDKINWTNVATKTAAGTSNSTIVYLVTDSSPMLGNNFYRLMQIDKNGAATISTILNVIRGTNNEISISPNPTNGFTTITFPQGYNALNKLSVLNTNGVTLKEITTQEQYYKLNTSSLSKGIYFIKVLNGNNLTTQKLLIF